MGVRGEQLCAWAGPLTIVLFVGSWTVCVGWLQPPSPSLAPEAVAAIYQDNTFGIRLGMLLLMYAGGMSAAFNAIIMVHMLRMQGPSPALAYTQLAAGTASVLLFVIPAQIYGAVAYRPDRLAEITQFGNDVGWFILDMVNSTAVVQVLALGVATLSDQRERPIFPRWFGFFNLWVAVLFLPVSLLTFFKTGPFAWSGVFGWYLGLIAFGTWYFVAFYVLQKAIRERDRAVAA
jgi:hypothetical protein